MSCTARIVCDKAAELLNNLSNLARDNFFFLRLPASGFEVDLPLIAGFPTTPQPDALGRTNEKPNVYNVFIYGEDITSTWAQHNDNLPTPPVTLTVQLVGRNKYANGKLFNNITLRLLKIQFHYE